MKNAIAGIFLMSILVSAGLAEARSVRATEMKSVSLSHPLENPDKDLVIEFRENDRLAVNMDAMGALFETADPIRGSVLVKKNFWIQVTESDLLISFDGTHFEPVQQRVGGAVTVNADQDPSSSLARALNIMFSSYLR